MKYAIYEGNMEILEKKISKIANKCKKYGCDITFKQTGELFKDVQVGYDEQAKKPIYKAFKFIEVEAEGSAVINGWEFVATIDHTANGNIFSKALTDVEIPDRYRHCKPFCEHCNSYRMRNNTFIVRDMHTGEFKQVGRNCLCDYTHGLSVELASYLASIRSVLDEETSDDYIRSACGSWKHYYNTKFVLQVASEWIRNFGYQKTTFDNGDYNPDSTRNKVSDVIGVIRGTSRDKDMIRTMNSVNFDENSAEAVELMKKAIAWITAQQADTDYMKNLQILVSNEYVLPKHFGYLCSLIQTYIRECEKQEAKQREAKENACSQYIGEEGKRIDVDIASGKCVTSWETDYGFTYVYKFTDNLGNVIIWKTSNWLNEDKITHIRGTVKEHSEYNGVKQTVLTRCKVEEGR